MPRPVLAFLLAGVLVVLAGGVPATAHPVDRQPHRAAVGGLSAPPAYLLRRAARANRRSLRSHHGRALRSLAVRGRVRAAVLDTLTDCSALYGGPFLCGSIRTPTIPGDPTAGTRLIDFAYRPADVQPAEAVSLYSDGPWISTLSSRDTWKPGFFAWAATAQGAELATRDVILVNVRSTGRDAVDCPLLNASDNPVGEAVAECVGILGRTIDYFTNGDAADDVDAVRAHLLGPDAKVDLVTMGHATSLGQAYLARYASHLRSAILDEAVDPNAWADVEIRENTAIVGRICARSARCSARIDDPIDQVRWLATRLQRGPITGWTTLPDGTPWHVTLVEQYAVGGIVFSGPFTFARSAGLPAAIRAYRKGDAVPLLRLAANAGIGDPGPSGPPLTFADDDPSEWSAVGIMAAGCNEWPAGWDVQADEATRRAQNAAAFAALPDDVFGVFSKAIFFGIDETCIRWPAPVRVNRINPPGAAFASVPILVLGGDLNSDHPQTAARTVAARYPNATFVRIPRGTQPSLASSTCAARIARTFLDTRRPGNTTCRPDEGSTVLGIGAFPRTVAGETPARRASGADHSTRTIRKVAAAAVDTYLDAIAQTWDAGAGAGPALRGGTWTYADNGDSATWTLDHARFVRDVAVSGDASVSFVGDNPVADLTVEGPGTTKGLIHVDAPAIFALGQPTAHVTGKIAGRTVDLDVDLH